MKLLYLSCHAVLEYDELKLFEELGVDYFSLGSYIIPQKPVDPIRPGLTKEVDQDILKIAPMRENMPKEFIDLFDVIIVMHGETQEGNWIEMNWEKMKHKRVIWRTIGQSTPRIEEKMKKYVNEGLEILRYSPLEANMDNFAGQSALIRFYKDEALFGPYNGKNQEIITFAQNMIERGESCHFDVFQKVTEGCDARVYGPKNENAGDLNGGFLTYDAMRQKYRDSRVYFYTGTQPASYTLNFIEAWMTGIPVIVAGETIGNSLRLIGNTYEVPHFITNGVDGFASDNYGELRDMLLLAYNNLEWAKSIGIAGRKKAIQLFGKEVIKKQWQEYLGVY